MPRPAGGMTPAIPMRTFELGWHGDDGLGERLCRQVVAGIKSATCAPKVAFTAKELAEAYAGTGELHALVDPSGHVWATIRVVDAFETTFGDPDPRLVRGEGDGDDVATFQRDHRAAWGAWLAAMNQPLTPETILIAELFELVADHR
jgi:uncharacterized protein YhfF